MNINNTWIDKSLDYLNVFIYFKTVNQVLSTVND